MNAATFAVLFIALYVGHTVGDHWVQTDGQAKNKGLHGKDATKGRFACITHCCTYTATQCVTVLLAVTVLNITANPYAIVAGFAVSFITHYIADRRKPLERLARIIPGKHAFWTLGVPRAGMDDNPSLGTGAYTLDQSWHIAWLFVATLVMVGW
jgi:hypothetical protein